MSVEGKYFSFNFRARFSSLYLAQYGDWVHVFLPVETGSSSFMVVELLAMYLQ